MHQYSIDTENKKIVCAHLCRNADESSRVGEDPRQTTTQNSRCSLNSPLHSAISPILRPGTAQFHAPRWRPCQPIRASYPRLRIELKLSKPPSYFFVPLIEGWPSSPKRSNQEPHSRIKNSFLFPSHSYAPVLRRSCPEREGGVEMS
ncbi:hypothetical protein TNIN_222921 [Trichonephila inaurata madagascariensis]|uniref:Uncharacterized protein n=1 Tax=Trichonephila inaurata madagascariensis TaxID=2747483 RepID=A0A8X6X0P5_9ARAC|nr:hypothetical protein TNIN_222921 [Trichonephila inaurata madagascariensis]